MEIKKEIFGIIDGKTIFLYKFKNKNNMEVYISSYGVTVTSILIPDEKDNKINIICGFNNMSGYFTDDFKNNAPYFGAIIGRYCATIQNSKYDKYTLTSNANGHCLHGGLKGFDKNVWASQIFSNNQNELAVKFSLLSPDGDQGFPGNINVSVIVSLNNNNELSFKYEANTDQRTPLSMTSHCYFNLSGFKENIENHLVKIISNKIFAMDAKGKYIDNITNVHSTLYDLSKEKRIGELHKEKNDGMENFYLFENGLTERPRMVAEITYPVRNRKLQVFTCEPGMLFYTAKYTSNTLKRESGEKYGKYCALCCETHRIPNGPNIQHAKNVFLQPNETFKSETIYKLSF